MYFFIEGSLEVKLPTIWTDVEEAEVGRVRAEKKTRKEKEPEDRRCRRGKVSSDLRLGRVEN